MEKVSKKEENEKMFLIFIDFEWAVKGWYICPETELRHLINARPFRVTKQGNICLFMYLLDNTHHMPWLCFGHVFEDGSWVIKQSETYETLLSSKDN